MIANPSVRVYDIGSSHLYGSYNHDTNVISVSSNQGIPNWRRRLALMHELWHWANRKYALSLSHDEVHLAAVYCTMAFRTNSRPLGEEVAALFKNPKFDLGDNVYQEVLKHYATVLAQTELSKK